MTTMNIEDFSEKAKEVVSSLQESFNQADLLKMSKLNPEYDEDSQEVIDNNEVINAIEDSLDQENNRSPVEYSIIDDEEPETFVVNGDIEDPIDDTLNSGETVQTSVDTLSIPFEEAPKFRIYWRAWKEGNSTSGQTESNLETAQMARAEAMSKLYDLGFTDLEILAIETIKSEEKSNSQI